MLSSMKVGQVELDGNEQLKVAFTSTSCTVCEGVVSMIKFGNQYDLKIEL